MCGIVCIGGELAARETAFGSALASLAPRGPDGLASEALSLGGVPLLLGHAQFHVLTLDAEAVQPMRSASGRSWLAFNGELYNHGDLAKGLSPRGGWRTRSDTEVLLEGLEQEGSAFLHQTNGMFAFVYVRLDRPELIAARDRLGIKPLYFARTSRGGWALASTVRSLVSSGLVPFDLSSEGLDSFLEFGSVYEPGTIVRGIEAVEPGTLLQWRPGSDWRVQRWWSFPQATGDLPLSAAGEELRALLVDSVRLRTPSRFPMGVFLSGGTDSSAVAMTLAESSTRKPVTLSLAFEGEDAGFSEAPYQREIARRTGSDHHEVVVDRSHASRSLDPFFDAMDQPTMDGFNVFLVAQAASALGVRTCLSGAGGDEIFAGYSTFETLPRYRATIRAIAAMPEPARRALAVPTRWLSRWRPLEPRLTKVTQLIRSVGGLQDYYALRRALFLPEQVARLRGRPGRTSVPRLSFAPEESTDGVQAWSALEIGNYLRNTLLRDADSFGMSHPVEVRVPLIDHRILELVSRIPGDEMVAGSLHKPALQAAMGGQLPRFTWARRKTGFNLPLRIWLQRGLARDPDLADLLDRAEVRRIVTAFRASPRTHRAWTRRWSLTVLERYVDSMRRAAVSPPVPEDSARPGRRERVRA